MFGTARHTLRWPLLALGVLLLLPPGHAVQARGTAAPSPTLLFDLPAPVVRLRDNIQDGNRLRDLNTITYPSLVASLPEVEALLAKHGPWLKVRSEGDPYTTDAAIASDLCQALHFASFRAPDAASARNWALREQTLVADLMRHPYSQYLWTAKHRSEEAGTRVPQALHLDLHRLTRWMLDFSSLRHGMVRRGLLRSEEWGVQQDLTWIDEPGAVVDRNGVVFVTAAVLRQLGVPLEVAAGSVSVRRAGRHARIPVGGPAPAEARTGFRDEQGRLYVPVEELYRQRVYFARVIRDSQMVEMSPSLVDLQP